MMELIMTGAEAAAAGQTDAELLAHLRAAIAKGEVRLDLDLRRLAWGDSPVAVQSEDNAWFFGGVAATLAAGWFAGWKAGLGALALAAVVYLVVARPSVRRRIERRVRDQAVNDVALWRKTWQFGGLTLVRVGTPGGECRSPDGNWFAFVRGE